MTVPQLSIRTTLLAVIILLNAMIAALTGADVFDSWVSLRQAQALNAGAVGINQLYRAERYLSLARAASVSVLYAPEDTAKAMQQDIASDRAGFQAAFDKALAYVRASGGANSAALAAQAEAENAGLRVLRAALDAALTKPPAARDGTLPDKIFDADTRLITMIRALIADASGPLQSLDAVVGQQMMFKQFVSDVTEYAGREYAVIGRLVAESRAVTPEMEENLVAWRALIRRGWEEARQTAAASRLDKKLAPVIDEAETHYFLTFDQTKDAFTAAATKGKRVSYPLSLEMWLELASQAVDSLLALKDASLDETQAYVARMERDAERDIALNMALFAAATGVSLYCLGIIVWRVITPVNGMVDALWKATRGEPYDPPAGIYRHDEIGKLAVVLDAFQENARQIRQSNEELERYAYITAHDLKSPLRAIDNLSSWIEEDLGDRITGDAKKHMDTLRARVRRMEKLLNDTLEYSRIGKQLKDDDGETVDGRALVEDAVSMAGAPKGFTVRVDPGFTGLELKRMPLQQVFYNLVNNAIKHHDSATGTIDVGVESRDGQYVFSVKDDGPGIPQQYHEKIFEMFQTLKPRDQREGSGMGLAIVRKIVMSAGGTIGVESAPGKGALFRFTWPKDGPKDGPKDAAEDGRKNKAGNGGTKKEKETC